MSFGEIIRRAFFLLPKQFENLSQTMHFNVLYEEILRDGKHFRQMGSENRFKKEKRVQCFAIYYYQIL